MTGPIPSVATLSIGATTRRSGATFKVVIDGILATNETHFDAREQKTPPIWRWIKNAVRDFAA